MLKLLLGLLLAVAVILHLAANAWLKGERAGIEAMLAEMTGAPAQVEQLRLLWRGAQPRMELRGVRLMLADEGSPPLRVRALRLGISYRDLLRGRLAPHHLQVRGMDMAVRENADGKWQLGTRRGDGAIGWEAVARQVAALHRIELRSIRLHLVPYQRASDSVELHLASATLLPERGGWRVSAELLDEAAMGALRLNGRVQGEATRPEHWRHHWVLRFDGDHNLRKSLGAIWPHAMPDLSDVRLRAELRRQGSGGSYSWLGTVSLSSARVTSADGKTLHRVHAETTARWQAGRAQAHLHRLDIDGVPKLEDMHVTFEQATAASPPLLRLRSNRLDLGTWAPWLAEALPYSLPGVQGQLTGVTAELHLPSERSDWRWRYAAELDDMHIAFPAGFMTGLSGRLNGDEAAGSLLLATDTATLALPDAFDAVAELSVLNADVQWTHEDEGIDFAVPSFTVALDSIDLRGDATMYWPRHGTPDIAVALQMRGEDVADAKPLMPQVWHVRLREYLDEAIHNARLLHGEVEFAARLEPGLWQSPDTRFGVSLDVEDGAMQFHPDWPAVTSMAAHLDIDRERITIRGQRARFVDMELRDLRVDIGPLNAAVLTAEVSHRDTLTRWYTMLAASPLADGLSGLLEQTRPEGEALVDFDLRIPLTDVEQTRARGRVSVAGSRLHVVPLESTVEDIHGNVHFVNQSVAAEGLRARQHGQPITGRIDTRDGVTRLHADSHIDIADGATLARFVPDALRTHLQGVLPARAEVSLTPVEGETRVELSLPTENLRSMLPDPLRFDSGSGGAPLRVALAVAAGDLRRLDVRLPGRAHYLRDGEQARLHLGAGVAPPASGDGLHLSGASAILDLAGWLPILRRLAAAPTAVAEAGDEVATFPLQPAVDRVTGTLDVTRLQLGVLTIPDLSLRLRDTDGALRVEVDGSSRGEIRWPHAAAGGARQVKARMDRVRIERTPPEQGAPAADAAAQSAVQPPTLPLSPAELPSLDVLVSDLFLNGLRLGSLDMQFRQNNGWHFDRFTVSGGAVKLQAEGHWRTDAASGSAPGEHPLAVDISLDTAQIDEVLTGFGYARTLQAERLRVDASLHWAALSEFGSLPLAEGSVTLRADDGVLHQVKPGAGRAIGLLNFYALPRRIAMDFRDVTETGLGFDALSGSFELSKGNARTEDLQVESPSLRVAVKGRVGLAKRDYDQRIDIYPQVSGGVTLGAAVLGGPVGMGLAVLLRELFDSPLDRATRVSYRLHGSWDDPQVTPVAFDTAEEEAR